MLAAVAAVKIPQLNFQILLGAAVPGVQQQPHITDEALLLTQVAVAGVRVLVG